MSLPLSRRASAEFAGTALLVTAVIGSGIAATRLSPTDTGLQLLENAIATALALGALILTFGPVSGAHLNPVVSAVDWWLGRRAGTGLTGRDLAAYAIAQTAARQPAPSSPTCCSTCRRWPGPAPTGAAVTCGWPRWSAPPAWSC